MERGPGPGPWKGGCCVSGARTPLSVPGPGANGEPDTARGSETHFVERCLRGQGGQGTSPLKNPGVYGDVKRGFPGV